jgi:hypothetical protein
VEEITDKAEKDKNYELKKRKKWGGGAEGAQKKRLIKDKILKQNSKSSLQCNCLEIKVINYALYRKSDFWIPRNENVRPRSQFKISRQNIIILFWK